MADQPDVSALLAQLEAERDELDVTISLLRRRLGLAASVEANSRTGNGGASDGGAGRDTALTTGRVRTDEFFRLSIADAVAKFLGIMKQPQNPMAIVNGLKSGGVLTNAKNFYANVNTELKRMRARELVVNTPSGWGLAEWYPSKPKQEPPKTKKKAKKKSAKVAKAAKSPKESKPATAATAKAQALKGTRSYTQFVAERRKAGKSLKEIGAEWTLQKATRA